MSQVTSTFYMNCWGCNRTLPRPYTSQEDHDRQIQELMEAGWQRRTFGPGADPWFCSNDCAYNSYHAKQAEAWWAKEKVNDYLTKLVIQIIVGSCLIAGLLVLVMMVLR